MAAQINRYRKSKRIIAARDCITRNSTAPQLGDTREQEGSGNCINIRSPPLLPHRPLDLCTLLPYGSRVSVPYIVCARACVSGTPTKLSRGAWATRSGYFAVYLRAGFTRTCSTYCPKFVARGAVSSGSCVCLTWSEAYRRGSGR